MDALGPLPALWPVRRTPSSDTAPDEGHSPGSMPEPPPRRNLPQQALLDVLEMVRAFAVDDHQVAVGAHMRVITLFMFWLSAMNALLTGEAHLMFAIVAPAVANAKAGRVRALAVTSAQRSALAPGLATMAEAGLPGFEVTFTPGLFAPAGTPAPIVERLHREITRLIERPEIRDKYLSVGMEALGQSPEIFAAAIKREIAVIGKVVKSAGIRDE